MSEASHSPPAAAPIATSGKVADTSVPALLAHVWAEQKTTSLRLIRGKCERRIQILEGAPIAVETSLGEDHFAQLLADARQISAFDRSKVEKFALDKECSQATAVMALNLLDAKALYQFLRDQTRNQISESLEWSHGDYQFEELPEDFKSVSKPFDTLALLQLELPKRWGTDRLFAALMPRSELVGAVAPRFHLILEKLSAAGPMAKQIIDRLGESASVGRLLGDCAGDPLAAATLWVLVQTELLQPLSAQSEDAETSPLKFEVEVISDGSTDARGASGSGRRTMSNKAARPEMDLKADAKGAALRAEIEALLPQVGDVTHYEALGLEEDASAVEIKKAYFRAAKKYHPDSLARIGLEDIKDSAAQIFTRISEAFETLSDPDKRASYDSGDAEPAEIDTARLTQAETSFRKGEILLRMGNFAGALEYLEPAVELWPEEPAYQQALGWALFKQPKPDPDRAQAHLLTALEQKPDDPSTLLRLGQIARSLGNEEAAADYAARARALNPNA